MTLPLCMGLAGELVTGKKKAARTVICSCREASDATCISQVVLCGLMNFHGRKLSLTLNQNIPQYGCEKTKICSIIEISRLAGRSGGDKNLVIVKQHVIYHPFAGTSAFR